MLIRLATVRAKLTAIVAFSAIITLAALPLLSWIMDRELVAQVHERVPAALRGFELELNEDLRDLTTIVDQLAAESEVAAALRAKDGRQVVQQGQIFHAAFPEIDLLFFDANDQFLAQVAVDAAPPNARAVPGLATLGNTGRFEAVVAHGCEAAAQAPPGFVAARRLPGVGMVVACLPLDADYLSEVHERLRVELAITAPEAQRKLDTTPHFPEGGVARATTASTLLETGKEDWALARSTPRAMQGPTGQYGAVIALDVTDIRNAVRHNLLLAVCVLASATLLSLALGARVAGVMSRALSRVNVALLKLQKHEYAYVDMIRTGDELEDLAVGFNAMIDGLQERDKLRTTFGKYMTETVMTHLMSGKVQLGGETLTVTILFSDIRSFTTISEQMNDAQALVALLNEYFTEMVSIVIQEDGVVDKYIGDAIMAVFGAPVSKPDDAVRAVRAAVRMRKALSDLNERLAQRGVSALRTGFGLHTGEVVAGNIGSEQRMEYTVIGDAVNLASRLETATKELGVDVLISADTYALVKETCVAEALGSITVKGRVEPVMLYSVTGSK